MPKPTKKKNVIKGWVVLSKEGDLNTVLAFEDCSQCGIVADVFGIFPTKSDAEAFTSKYREDKVKRVEITLTYEA